MTRNDRVAALESRPEVHPPLVCRVGYADGKYFDETREQALARLNLKPAATQTVIFIFYGD